MSSAVPTQLARETAAPYRLLQRRAGPLPDEREAVISALMQVPANVSPKYFYDELGCALYGAICRLPEYYPTRTENALFHERRAEMTQAMGQGTQFVDLGAGDCGKALAWLAFANPSRYIAVDIAGEEIEQALARMAPDHPAIEMIGVVMDFSRSLDLEGILDGQPVTFFYPGSSIGNFSPEDACGMLSRIREACERRPASGLLIGVDGKKERAILEAAYDDNLGVTAAFNRNLLLHLNRRFGFDFAPAGYIHRAFYDPAKGRIEMHLEAVRQQQVSLGARVRSFTKGERIHTENSYKYRPQEFANLLRQAGFATVQSWTTADEGYAVFHAS